MRARLAKLMLERLIVRHREYKVYRASADHAPHHSPANDASLCFDVARPPTPVALAHYTRHFGRFRSRPMLHRLYHHGAVLLMLVEQDQLRGMGWVQRGQPLEREFWWLPEGAVCLGPFWTHPDHRRQGVYGRLLAAAVDQCRRRGWERMYIWAQSRNEASIRGIEKAGFVPMGTHRVASYCMGLVRRHEAVGGPESES